MSHTANFTESGGSIVHTFKKRALTGLLSGRGGVLVEANKQVTSTSDFQLMTWLVD